MASLTSGTMTWTASMDGVSFSASTAIAPADTALGTNEWPSTCSPGIATKREPVKGRGSDSILRESQETAVISISTLPETLASKACVILLRIMLPLKTLGKPATYSSPRNRGSRWFQLCILSQNRFLFQTLLYWNSTITGPLEGTEEPGAGRCAIARPEPFISTSKDLAFASLMTMRTDLPVKSGTAIGPISSFADASRSSSSLFTGSGSSALGTFEFSFKTPRYASDSCAISLNTGPAISPP